MQASAKQLKLIRAGVHIQLWGHGHHAHTAASLTPAARVSRRYAGVQESTLCEVSKRHDQGTRLNVTDAPEQDGDSCACHSACSCSIKACVARTMTF